MAARRKAAGGKGSKMMAETGDLMITTIRITRAQWDALRRVANERALAGETGDRRPDASRIVREAIDAWLEKNVR